MKTLHIAFAIAALTCAGVVSAGTITVDAGGGGDHTTIQAAIDAAVTGDIVEIIDSGTYVEGLRIGGQGITLRSAGAPATVKPTSPYPGGQPAALWINGLPEAPTGAPAGNILVENLILDAGDMSGNNSVVYIDNWSIGSTDSPIDFAAEVRLKDCEIMNSGTAGQKWEQAGVFIGTDSVVIDNCDIHDCRRGVTGRANGPGHKGPHVTANIHIIGGSMSSCRQAVFMVPKEDAAKARGYNILQDGVTIEFNDTMGNGGYEGYSAFVNNVDGYDIVDCTYDNNKSSGFGNGAHYFASSTDVSVTGTTMSNSAQSGSTSGTTALHLDGCTGSTVSDSQFIDNGEGIRVLNGDAAISDSCIKLPQGGVACCGGGMGIEARNGAVVTVDHCTIHGENGADNKITAQDIRDIATGLLIGSGGGTITATNCIYSGLSLPGAAIGGQQDNLSISNSNAYNIGFWWGAMNCYLSGGDLDTDGGYGAAVNDITGNVDGGGNLFCGTEVDPAYLSTTPGDADFLSLSCSTPASVITGASDGTFMGAKPLSCDAIITTIIDTACDQLGSNPPVSLQALRSEILLIADNLDCSACGSAAAAEMIGN